MLELFSNGFRITALFLLLVFSVAVVLLEDPSFKKNILLFFLLTTGGYLLAYWEIIRIYPALFHIVFFIAVLFPFSFWLLSKALFDDEFSWKKKYWFFFLFISLSQYLLYRFNELFSTTLYRHFKIIPYLISVFFIFLVIYESLRNRKNDLVVLRLKKRNIFVLFSSLIALVTVYYFFVANPWMLPMSFQVIQNIFICIFIILFFSDQFMYKSIFRINLLTRDGMKDYKDKIILDRIIEQIKILFEEEKVFKNEGITIAHLGAILKEKDYLIRRAINNEMGFTNFNTFLNYYRIREAQKIMSQSQIKKYTFQEIAYQVGYQSIATFNRAFKNETGKTPSQFTESLFEQSEHKNE